MSHLSSMPALRDDLEVIPRRDKDGSFRYLVKDPATKEVFDLGENDYFLCTQFDGQSALPDIRTRFESRFNIPIDTEQMDAFVRLLGQEGLLAGYKTRPPSVWNLLQFQDPENWKKWKLFDPGALTAWLAKRLWWVYTRTFVIASIVFFLLAVGTFFNNFHAFIKDFETLFRPLNIFLLIPVYYFCITIPGVLSRGVTSANYGGHANEFGIWLIFDVWPSFYCWVDFANIQRKYQRNLILSSAILYDLLITSIGMLIWRLSSPGILLHTFGLILAFDGPFDLLTRINPLWPTDVYFIMVQWLEFPLFRKRAISVANAWLFRRPMPEPLTTRDRSIFKWYGLLTAGTTFPSFAILVYFLSETLIEYLAGAGALIVLFFLTVKYRKALAHVFKRMKEPIIVKDSKPKKRILRHVLIGGTVLIIMFIPYPYEPGGPFKFLPIHQVEVHTQVSGEIKQVLVKEGDLVKEGQVLTLLDTREHQKNLDVTQADLDKARADLERLEAGPKPEEVEKARQELENAKTHYEYSEREAKRLEVLYKGGAVAQEEYEKAAKTAAVDAKNVEVAKANLDLVKSGARPEELEAQRAVVHDLEVRLKYFQENLSLTRLVSPISGKVATPYMETKVGQILKENDLLAVIHDLQKIQAEIQIPEPDIDEVKLGARAKIRLWADPTEFYYGDVVSIAPKADETPNGKIVRVVVEIPNPFFLLKPDMTGEAKIEGEWKPLIVAFTRAIVRFVMVEVWSWLP